MISVKNSTCRTSEDFALPAGRRRLYLRSTSIIATKFAAIVIPFWNSVGLVLYRLAQGQFFMDGNKRTAVIATTIFLKNQGLTLKLDRQVVSELTWGFAVSMDGTPAKYVEDDVIQFIFNSVLPRNCNSNLSKNNLLLQSCDWFVFYVNDRFNG